MISSHKTGHGENNVSLAVSALVKRWAATIAAGALIAAGGLVAASSAAADSVQTAPSVSGGQSTRVVGMLPMAAPVAKRSATLTSSIGQAPTGAPKLSSVSVVQDVKGQKVSVTAEYSGTPKSSTPDWLFVYLGTWKGSTCDVTAGLGLATNATKDAGAMLLPSTNVTAAVKVNGKTLTLTASGNSRLGSTKWQCATAMTADPFPNPAVTYQNFAAKSLKTTYVKKAKLRTSVTSTVAVRSGKTAKVRIAVKNTGTATASKVRVRLTGSKLTYSKKSIYLGSIKPGQTKKVSVRVKLTGNTARTGKATATASGNLRSAKNFKVLRYKKTTTPKSLSGKYYWGWRTSYSKGWDNTAIMFVDRKWAYMGVPSKGKPKCSKSVKKCAKYSYNSRTGTLKIGKKTGKVTSKSLRLGKQKYAPLSIPKKGTKLNVALVHKDFNGCFGGPVCTTWTESLLLSKNGRFVRTKDTISGFSVPGVSQTWYNGAGPKERGKYKVLSQGRILFTYASGKKVIRAIGIEQDVSERAAPQSEGLLLGSVNFYPR